MTAPRIGLIAAALLAYAFGTHVLMSQAPASPWTVALVLGPMALAGAVLAARTLLGRWLLGVLLGVAAAGWVMGHTDWWQPRWLYLAQHVGVQGMLGAAFGLSLRAGHTPLITLLASRVHRELTPAMVDYTRAVTLAWTLEFALVVVGSLALYAWAPLAWWSLWANVATPVLAIGLFVGEYLLRYRLHPEFERVTLADAVRAWRTQMS